MTPNLFRAALAAAVPLALATPGLAQGLGFAAVGPVNAEHGYPDWYEDTNGLRLDLCLETTGFCLLEGPSQVVLPGAPFPDNFGGSFTPESFYNLAEASMPTNGGGQAILILALEAAFDPEIIADGNQVVFARFRLRVDNLVAGETYVVTTPVGVFSFVAESSGVRGINFTDDVGRLAGAFDGALSSTMVGPFLMWDSDLPIVDVNGREYVGDPNVEHTITGSPYGTNLFRIEGPNVGGPGIHSIETDLFAVSGLLSLDAGDPGDPGDPPPDPQFLHTGPAPGVAGVLNTLGASGATPGGQVAFMLSFTAGAQTIMPGPCPAGVALDLVNPRFLGIASADLDGNASRTVRVPPFLAGMTVHTQAIDVATCAASNAVTTVLGAPIVVTGTGFPLQKAGF